MLAAAALASLAIRYRNTGVSQGTAVRDRPANVYARPESVPFTGARKKAAGVVVREFIDQAVLRKNPGASWELVTPSFRQGLTRAQWRTGNIPVVPFPTEDFAEARSMLAYSYLDRVGLEVALLPKPGAETPATVFTLELRPVGAGSRKHWLVSSWAPAPTLNPRPPLSAGGPTVAQHSPLSATWLLVPAGVVGLALLIPVGIGVREWRRRARAARAYSSSSTPPYR